MASQVETLLKQYRSKRDFSKTAEPDGARRRKAGEPVFVVQKHDATRLHYDFRLELDGVLKSWAVTKGPSLDPADKRLAVRVEDHPLDYADFEGTIPRGEYGGGTVMLWDFGTWEPDGDPRKGLRKGELKFTLHGGRLRGSFVLVHMKGRDVKRRDGEVRENWLLIKHGDEAAQDADSVTESFTTSIDSGRDLDAIAAGKPGKGAEGKGKGGKRVWSSHAPTTSAGIAAAEETGIRLTSPDRVVFPGQGVTQALLVDYYAAVADVMLPYLADRPLSLVRCPQGRAKHCFFQKHDNGSMPDAIRKVPVREKDGEEKDYLYVDSIAGLIGGVQMNALEWHVWGSRRDRIEKPERIVFDIDPDEGLAFGKVRDAAFDLRDTLEALGLKSYAMVTGGKGVHVIAPLARRLAWPGVKAFCRGVAEKLAQADSARFTTNMSKARRKGRMFLDYLRNERGSTAIAPWSTRSREGAPCAVPIGWDELPSIQAANAFSLTEATRRARGDNPWPDYFDQRQSITNAMLEAVDADVSD